MSYQDQIKRSLEVMNLEKVTITSKISNTHEELRYVHVINVLQLIHCELLDISRRLAVLENDDEDFSCCGEDDGD